MVDRPDVTPEPPWVAVPMMLQEWRSISFVHWRADADVVASHLPDWVALDTYDGAAWVSLVPFRMLVRGPVGPVLPWVGNFPETNVRTYVVDRRGRRGLWFLSMDAARLPFVTAARAIGLPYIWSSMRVDASAARLRYRTRSRLAGGPPARSLVELEPGPALEDDEAALDRFLTARFRLFASGPLGPFSVAVEHPRWRLRHAAITRMDDALVPATGIPTDGDPLVHTADGVTVRVGPPTPVPRDDA